MSFGSFKTVGEVARKFDIEVADRLAFTHQKAMDVPELMQAMIVESMNDGISFINEITICERIISPILNIVSRHYERLNVWSHVTYNVNEAEGLVGEPDYLIAPKTKYGEMARPSLCVIEAKRDNFEEGWAQALAEMAATATLDAPLCYGVVTTGKTWEFGKLEMGKFVIDTVSVSATDNLQRTFDTLNWMFGDIALRLEAGE